ncbi:MAG: hypothetical protein LPD71_03375 [Shewanella sp.]|nr:hypothetical protein [Shewanella sp.]MCF1430709.1 hypothetical protein [Shewanella sp.]MCF1437810.1 hypothetical protein [Shewanella sp.]MCF1458230.1 hypothetical protein [Shewanella sp.]
MATQTITHDSVAAYQPSQADLRLIFSRQKLFWPNGEPITVFILQPDSSEHRQFCIEVLELTPYVLQRRWDRLVYSGTGDRPKIVSNEQLMKTLVSVTSGAIGYLVSDSVSQGGDHEGK